MKSLRKLRIYASNLFGNEGLGKYEIDCYSALSNVDIFGGRHGNIRVVVGTEDDILEKLEPTDYKFPGRKINLSERKAVADVLQYLSNKCEGRYVAFSSDDGRLIHPDLMPRNPHHGPKQIASLYDTNTVFELSGEWGIRIYKRGEVISPSLKPNRDVLNLRQDIYPHEDTSDALRLDRIRAS